MTTDSPPSSRARCGWAMASIGRRSRFARSAASRRRRRRRSTADFRPCESPERVSRLTADALARGRSQSLCSSLVQSAFRWSRAAMPPVRHVADHAPQSARRVDVPDPSRPTALDLRDLPGPAPLIFALVNRRGACQSNQAWIESKQSNARSFGCSERKSGSTRAFSLARAQLKCSGSNGSGLSTFSPRRYGPSDGACPDGQTKPPEFSPFWDGPSRFSMSDASPVDGADASPLDLGDGL